MLRKGLPPLPDRMKALPLNAGGYPIPWFVETLKDGTRDFRIMDAHKRVLAFNRRLCWVCGQKLGVYMSFVVGPMCVVNRNTAEPPCHLECAQFAARACPFMLQPGRDYRMPNVEGIRQVVGMLPGNPGAAAIWVTKSYTLTPMHGDIHVTLGDPVEVHWYAEGKLATRQQILDSLARRLPLVREVAEKGGLGDVALLERMTAEAMEWIPK